MYTTSGRSPTPTATACFSISAYSDPCVLPRVLEVFAKQGLMPDTLHSVTAGEEGEEQHIDLQMRHMSEQQSQHMARALRQIYLVNTVLTSDKQHFVSHKSAAA